MKGRFVLVMEQGTLVQVDALNEEDFEACDDGIMSIIDCEKRTEWFDGNWVEIDKG